ncbi:MAG: hypothetical protein GY835_23730 [bacterium]|nr:hypothetical protein [bacterium]
MTRETGTQVDAIVEAYLRQLTRELPSAVSFDWASHRPHSDDKLLRLVHLAKTGELFVDLSELEFNALMAKAARVDVRSEVFIGTPDKMSRRPAASEIAQRLGISYRAYRKVVTRAHQKVLARWAERAAA